MHMSPNIMSATNISNFLLQNINEPLPVETQFDIALTWGKSLLTLPVFTRREIEPHVRECGKLKGKAISKTLVRGRFFKHYVFFQVIQYTLHLTCCIFMSKLDAKQV